MPSLTHLLNEEFRSLVEAKVALHSFNDFKARIVIPAGIDVHRLNRVEAIAGLILATVPDLRKLRLSPLDRQQEEQREHHDESAESVNLDTVAHACDEFPEFRF